MTSSDVSGLVVVAWPDKLCFYMRDCEDIHRPRPPSSHRRQAAFDDPLDGNRGIYNYWARVLVHVDAAMPACIILLAKVESPWGRNMYEHRLAHRYGLCI